MIQPRNQRASADKVDRGKNQLTWMYCLLEGLLRLISFDPPKEGGQRQIRFVSFVPLSPAAVRPV